MGAISFLKPDIGAARRRIGGKQVINDYDSKPTLTLEKTTKDGVFEALEGEDVEQNEQGEVALHGRTVWVWTTAVPGAPLKDGG